MSIADILRNGIATARTITLPLHVSVTHQAWTGQNYEGTPVYVTTVRLALVERKQRAVRNMTTGQQDLSTTYIAIIEPIPPTTALPGYTRTNPVDVNDIFTIPDGTTGPILSVDGFFDGGRGVTYYTQIYLG